VLALVRSNACRHGHGHHCGHWICHRRGVAALAPTRSTYDVTLKPETKVIDAATMARAYRGATSDGMLTFDAAAAPEVAAMAPGTVAIFAGVALLRVSSVTSTGGKIAVAGTP